MRLFTIKNQPDQPRYGELVLHDDNDKVIYDIVYDGKGYHNYPHQLDGDYRQAWEQWNTYGWRGLTEYLDHLDKYYKRKVKENK